MADCGCKPCSKPLPKKAKACKPFSLCVGNYTLIWDGVCPTIQPREYQIPDGTYTSITFQDGCIVGVGEAPIPQYTPRQCCDNGKSNNDDVPVGSNVTVSLERGNLVTMTGNAISVVPHWDTQGNISVSGNGTVNNPWKPNIKISKQTGNTLVEKKDGLFANLFFKSTGSVEVKGDGTQKSPFTLSVNTGEAKLPKINEEDVEGNGFTIDEQGRWKVEKGLKVVTNLQFDNPAFTVVDQGMATMVLVDSALLQNGVSLQVGDGLSGKGTTTEPLKLVLNEKVVGHILTVIEQNATLKQRLKTILGV